VRLGPFFVTVCLIGAACTPEAKLVDDPNAGGATGSAGQGEATAGKAPGSAAAGSGGEAGSGVGGSIGTGGEPECSELTSPRAGCAECVAAQCPAELAACEGTACLCGASGDKLGQINCALGCPGNTPMADSINGCNCFTNLMNAAEPTRTLFECLVVPPMGPPSCPECFDQDVP
jgi:hypothetical protein